jgi:betaine reductase
VGEIRIVHYLNQFFSGVGGEEKADMPPASQNRPLGPGIALQESVKGKGKVVGTVSCGDNYFNHNVEKAREEVFGLISSFDPEIVIAGPAFDSGRYGLACAHVCLTVNERLNIPVVSGMHPDNPGVELCRSKTYVAVTKASVAGMREAISTMATLALRLAKGIEIGSPEEEGYIARGIYRNVIVDKCGGERAVEMLLKKIRGEPFTTELRMPVLEQVTPPPPIKDMRNVMVALVTEGGIVPKGNPDRLEWGHSTKWLKYNIAATDRFTEGDFIVVEGSSKNQFTDADPNRTLPLDTVRELERAGRFKKLSDHYYVTVGNVTAVENCRRYGSEIAEELLTLGVQAVILTAT